MMIFQCYFFANWHLFPIFAVISLLFLLRKSPSSLPLPLPYSFKYRFQILRKKNKGGEVHFLLFLSAAVFEIRSGIALTHSGFPHVPRRRRENKRDRLPSGAERPGGGGLIKCTTLLRGWLVGWLLQRGRHSAQKASFLFLPFSGGGKACWTAEGWLKGHLFFLLLWRWTTIKKKSPPLRVRLSNL